MLSVCESVVRVSCSTFVHSVDRCVRKSQKVPGGREDGQHTRDTVFERSVTLCVGWLDGSDGNVGSVWVWPGPPPLKDRLHSHTTVPDPPGQSTRAAPPADLRRRRPLRALYCGNSLRVHHDDEFPGPASRALPLEAPVERGRDCGGKPGKRISGPQDSSRVVRLPLLTPCRRHHSVGWPAVAKPECVCSPR